MSRYSWESRLTFQPCQVLTVNHWAVLATNTVCFLTFHFRVRLHKACLHSDRLHVSIYLVQGISPELITVSNLSLKKKASPEKEDRFHLTELTVRYLPVSHSAPAIKDGCSSCVPPRQALPSILNLPVASKKSLLSNKPSSLLSFTLCLLGSKTNLKNKPTKLTLLSVNNPFLSLQCVSPSVTPKAVFCLPS